MSVKRRGLGLAMAVGLMVGAGCAQTPDSEEPEAAPRIRALDPAFGLGGMTRVSLSAEAERFVAVAPGPDGSWFAAGFLTTGGDQAMAVAKFDEDGDLDKTFDTDGSAFVNVTPGGKTGERASGVGVQSDGSVILAGPVEHDPSGAAGDARDTDVAAVRLKADGSLDTTFGTNGIARIDLGAGRPVEENFVGDTMYGVTVLEDDKIVLVGAKLHDGPDESDRDWAVIRLTEDGQKDTGFGTDGVFVQDFKDGNESPRQALELADGTLVVSGYTGNANDVVAPVLFKLDGAGKLVTDFGTDGFATAEFLPLVAEAYSVAQQGDGFVITGYGRSAEDEPVNMIAGRFTAAGERDTSFGENGIFQLDIAGQDDRGRDVVVLKNGSILIAGSGKPTADNIDGMLVMLTEDGRLDTTFGRGGILRVDLGGGGDSFFSVGLTEDEKAAVVSGWMGPTSTSGGNEEGVIARLVL